MKNENRIQVRLWTDRETAKAFKETAKKYDMSMSKFLGEILRQYVKEKVF